MARQPPLLRGVRSALLAASLRALSVPMGAASWARAQRAGALLGTLAWRLSRRDRRRALEHLAIAFPDLGPEARESLAAASFRHLGVTLGETLHLLRRDREAVLGHVAFEGWQEVERARAARRPVLIVTGHCGNWELLAAAINCRGLGMSVVARKLDEAALDRLLVGLRARFGTRTIARGEPGAARALLQAVRGGRALGMLIDQDTKVDGVWVPFLGRPAFTPMGAAELARRLGAAAIPAFIERLADGSHRARFQPPLALSADPVEATAQLTRPIEAQIRRVPEQWVWLHRRWRRQPPAG